MITPWLVVRLGLSQLLCWGVSYYLIGVLGEAITRDFGWSMTLTYSGFSGALVVMGLTSGWVGRLIDRHGGRPVMVAGSLLLVTGLSGLALSRNLIVYDVSWAFLGLAMRMTLYEAAFAALACIGGAAAQRPISQITLLGGLASTTFWPVGHALSEALGWRGAVFVYAAIALATLPLHWSIPDRRRRSGDPLPATDITPLARERGDRIAAGSLYMLLVTLGAFLNSGMSAHMIGIISGLGVSAGLAVWLSTLRGIGQSGARLCEVVFGAGMSPLVLGIVATALLPLAFFAGLFSGGFMLAGAFFALAYGAGNGLLTIARGTQPLVLFGNVAYGAVVGRLAAPGFFVSAFAPIAYAAIIEHMGEVAALYASTALALVVAGSATMLWLRFRRRS